MKPLNGTKTHPLKAASRDALYSLLNDPLPTQEFNPGVVDRLLRGEYVETISLPGPYKDRRNINHLKITDLGRREVLG